MSISTISNNITRLLKEIADLRYKKSLEFKKENTAKEKILSIQKTITKNTSLTTLNSKRSEISRKDKEASDSQSKQADFDKKLAEKEGRLLKERQALAKAENVEQKKIDALEKNAKESNLIFNGS